MLKKKVKVAEVVEEKKTEILKSEEVVPETPVVEATPVAQMAAAVEPVVVPVVDVVPEQMPEVPVNKNNWLWPIWIAVAFVLGAGAGFGLSKVSFDKKAKPVAVMEKKEVVSPTVKPTEAVEKKFDRGTIKIKVLNGSGVRGAAAVKQTALEKLGYKDVVVGNIEGDNYKNSEISYKDSLKIFEVDLLKDLAAATADKKTLALDDAFDVLFIIGEK